MDTGRTMADYNEDYENAAYVLHNFYNDLYKWVQRPAWMRWLWNPNRFNYNVGLCGNLSWYLIANPSMRRHEDVAEAYQSKLFRQQYGTSIMPFGNYTGKGLYIQHHVRMEHLDRYRDYPTICQALRQIG